MNPLVYPKSTNVDSHLCRFPSCGKSFATSVGRDVHKQRAHKERRSGTNQDGIQESALNRRRASDHGKRGSCSYQKNELHKLIKPSFL